MQHSSLLSPCAVSALPVVRARAWRRRCVIGARACCRSRSICAARKRARTGCLPPARSAEPIWLDVGRRQCAAALVDACAPTAIDAATGIGLAASRRILRTRRSGG
ncbi:hypothetical protein [Xanthomonas tesorieronis]|uniref:hypothetical protein n=1 Tax=Xanthomonas tesorieronis TaxID=3160839 RepID=UPI003511DFC7